MVLDVRLNESVNRALEQRCSGQVRHSHKRALYQHKITTKQHFGCIGEHEASSRSIKDGLVCTCARCKQKLLQHAVTYVAAYCVKDPYIPRGNQFLITQGQARNSFMRPAARRALKLALRMHSAALSPALASKPLQPLPSCTSSSSCTFKTSLPQSGSLNIWTAPAPELGRLAEKRLHKVGFSGAAMRNIM